MDQLELLSHKAEKQAQCCADTASLGHMADENGATGLLHAHGPFSGGSNRFKLQQPLRATCASTLCSYQMMDEAVAGSQSLCCMIDICSRVCFDPVEHQVRFLPWAH